MVDITRHTNGLGKDSIALASYPGPFLRGGEKQAWYTLHAHACAGITGVSWWEGLQLGALVLEKI